MLLKQLIVFSVCVLTINAFTHNELRILGGRHISVEKVPYSVGIQYGGRHYCGGSIISDKVVVTACHCTFGKYPEVMTVRAGSVFNYRGGKIHTITSIKQHPMFDPRALNYDIALLILTKPFKWSPQIKPIKLQSGPIPEGSTALINGWGATAYPGALSTVLQAAEITVLDRNYCAVVYPNFNDNIQVCAGNLLGGVGACFGDSGGPLVVGDELIGVVSFGAVCGEAFQPGAFTSIAATSDWITQHVSPSDLNLA